MTLKLIKVRFPLNVDFTNFLGDTPLPKGRLKGLEVHCETGAKALSPEFPEIHILSRAALDLLNGSELAGTLMSTKGGWYLSKCLVPSTDAAVEEEMEHSESIVGFHAYDLELSQSYNLRIRLSETCTAGVVFDVTAYVDVEEEPLASPTV